MSTPKHLPYDKTVVTEFKVQLADLLTRSVILKGSVAAPIPTDSVFNQGDVTITALSPLHIPPTKSVLMLSSLEDFVVDISGAATSITLKCRGLFINNGETGSVIISPPDGVDRIRLQYLWS